MKKPYFNQFERYTLLKEKKSYLAARLNLHYQLKFLQREISNNFQKTLLCKKLECIVIWLDKKIK